MKESEKVILLAQVKAAQLDQLIAEAKEIIDDPDGYDMLFDFVLGVAGLDGDPEYQ